jgi:hypothetical protein
MKSINLTLGQILTSPSQYVIPVFQRYYRWDQPQWDKPGASRACVRPAIDCPIPRACYELHANSGVAFWSMSKLNATYCSPASGSKSRS